MIKIFKTKIMSPFIVGLLVPLGAFAMIFGIVYMKVTARNRERLALIERGADPSLFETVKGRSSYGILKWGLFLVGIGLGFIIGDIVVKNGVMNEDYGYVSMICVFGGLALVASHFLLSKREKEENLGV